RHSVAPASAGRCPRGHRIMAPTADLHRATDIPSARTRRATMAGKMVEFPANGATTAAYLAAPKAGKGPGVVVIQEWWGLVDHIKKGCDRFANEGFSALAPDLYHGKTAKEPDEAGKLFMALNVAQAEKDLKGAVTHLLQHSSTKKVGVVGFCMG